MIFTNKHVIVAMLVAPILAIFAWFGVDMMVAETPIEPVAGETYRLVEKPNCRWASGECELKNNNFEVRITANDTGGGQRDIVLESSHPLRGVKLAVFQSAPETIDRESEPADMQSLDQNSQKWGLIIEEPLSELARFRIAIKAEDSLFFGETSTTFMWPEKKD